MASILLIDDDENLRILAAEVLRGDGHTVDTANDGKSGLELYKAWLPDLVITDIVMADMDGLQLIEELAKLTPKPRVIAMSGDTKLSVPVYLPLAKGLGVERILAKPFRPDVFLQTVSDVLAKPAQPAVAPGSAVRPPGREGV
jgi:CheY-like chemotaxis protein